MREGKSYKQIPEDKLLILITARGGSKGLPRKNCVTLGGGPLLSWSYEAVRQAGLHQATCLLSTDDEEIAEIGSSIGLDVPFLRPNELAHDTATVEDVAFHAIEWLEKERQFVPEAVMWLLPTAPFRNPRVLRQAFETLNQPNVDSVIGIKVIYRTLKTLFYGDENMELLPIDENDVVAHHRQQAKPIYTPNGTVYITKLETLRKTKSRFTSRMRGIITDQVSGLDVDDKLDLSIAEAVCRANLTWREIT